MGYKKYVTENVTQLSQSVSSTDSNITGTISSLSSSFSSSQAALSSSFTASMNSLSSSFSSSQAALSSSFSSSQAALSSSFTASMNSLSSSFSSSFNSLNTQVVTPTVTAVAQNSMNLINNSRYFTKTMSGIASWTFENVPASGAIVVCLELTNGGTGTQTWPASVKWPGGTAPTLTTSGVDVLAFVTDDGGTTWRGVVLMTDSK